MTSELVPKKEENIQESLDFNELMNAIKNGFKDEYIQYAIEFLENAAYIRNKELYDGIKIKFLTNALKTGRWERGNLKYSFLVIQNNEIKRFDTDLKFLMHLIPFLEEKSIQDLRGKILYIKKIRNEHGHVKYNLEIKEEK